MLPIDVRMADMLNDIVMLMHFALGASLPELARQCSVPQDEGPPAVAK
jgi:hypothetical protein